jgi:hypothetical protein
MLGPWRGMIRTHGSTCELIHRTLRGAGPGLQPSAHTEPSEPLYERVLTDGQTAENQLLPLCAFTVARGWVPRGVCRSRFHWLQGPPAGSGRSPGRCTNT